MKLTGFDILNFKGIRSAALRFSESDYARVHTLVGLNESGKTTLLEALHSFSPDAETQLVVKSARSIDEQRGQWVPRDQISSFTGEVSICAHVSADPRDWGNLAAYLEKVTGLKLDVGGLPDRFTVRLVHSYSNGDFRKTKRVIDISTFKVKAERGRKFRAPNDEEIEEIGEAVHRFLPTIAYYPTFVFDFPSKIYLTNRDSSPRNRFYRQLFQDILDFDGTGYTIGDSILARLRRPELKGPWTGWFSSFVGTTEEDKVKQVIARAELAVTKLVFSKWNEVFGEQVGGKSISIDLQYERGLKQKNPSGEEVEATEHDAYIRFRIKDGSSLYSVEDRSLGFRWFFSFLLFTQFRLHRENKRATIFLFDEPASNLHAAAQQKLLESFPSIAKYPHRLMYSTHSHYMVEPKWLEQAYIVFDKSSTPDGKIIDESVRSDSRVDIQVIPYRRFVSERPLQTSYFQPILDTLEVVPSRFDIKHGGLIVEGKSDYYLLCLAASVVGVDIGRIFPATGSGTMGALVSLHRGWGLPVRVLFDGDRGGRDGKKHLMTEFSLLPSEVMMLSEIDPGVKNIEDIFTKADLEEIVGPGTKEKKAVLLRRAQEFLASEVKPQLSKETMLRMRRVLADLARFCEQ